MLFRSTGTAMQTEHSQWHKQHQLLVQPCRQSTVSGTSNTSSWYSHADRAQSVAQATAATGTAMQTGHSQWHKQHQELVQPCRQSTVSGTGNSSYCNVPPFEIHLPLNRFFTHMDTGKCQTKTKSTIDIYPPADKKMHNKRFLKGGIN